MSLVRSESVRKWEGQYHHASTASIRKRELQHAQQPNICMIKEICRQSVSHSVHVASRQEVVTILPSHPRILAEHRRRVPNDRPNLTVKITTRQPFYLPYQALSLPIVQPGETDVTVPARVESRAALLPDAQRLAATPSRGSHAATMGCGRPRRIAYLYSWEVLGALKHSLVGIRFPLPRYLSFGICLCLESTAHHDDHHGSRKALVRPRRRQEHPRTFSGRNQERKYRQEDPRALSRCRRGYEGVSGVSRTSHRD
jgi:hypothetical protein